MNRGIGGPAVALAAALSLTACGHSGDEAAADNLERQYDVLAEQQEGMADNATNALAERAYEANAAALREEGDAAAESLEKADPDLPAPRR